MRAWHQIPLLQLKFGNLWQDLRASKILLLRSSLLTSSVAHLGL